MPPLDELPGEVVVSTREELKQRWLKSHRGRVPEADTGPNSQPDVDAGNTVDVVLPILAAAKISGQNAVLEQARGKALDQWGEREGAGERRGSIGASGFVTVRAAVGGETVAAGAVLVDESTRLRYELIETNHYNDGDPAPISGLNTGIATNADAGKVLKWESPPEGIFQEAVVIQQFDGSGLSGGREAENDDEYIERILEEKRTRAASGNDADYQSAIQNTPGVAVQKAFTYATTVGPGVISWAATMRPAYPGGSRVPNATHISKIEGNLGGFPADDGQLSAVIVNENADIVYGVSWAEGASGWEDGVPWPRYYAAAGAPGAVVVSSATSPTSFVLAAQNANYTNVLQPQIGQTIAFFNPAESAKIRFRRKRILTIVGTGPWTITCETANAASDVDYTPAAGQRAMPWSKALESMLSGLFAYFDGLGPAEQHASFYDEGRRQKRIPRPPKDWPFTLTSRRLVDAVEIDDIEDVSVIEGDGLTPTVGVPGVQVNMLKLRYVAVFPEI